MPIHSDRWAARSSPWASRGVPEVHAPLLSKLQALDASSPLSHYKAVCLALRLNKDPSLAEPLADLLNKPGVKGHVQPLKYYDASGTGQPLPRHKVNASGGDQLNAKFKEFLVAALLYECGDDDGQGLEILEAYAKDVNGHFAAYADLVLTTGTALADAGLGDVNGDGRVNAVDGVRLFKMLDGSVPMPEPGTDPFEAADTDDDNDIDAEDANRILQKTVGNLWKL